MLLPGCGWVTLPFDPKRRVMPGCGGVCHRDKQHNPRVRAGETVGQTAGQQGKHINTRKPKKLGRINKGFEKRYNNTLKRDSDKIVLWALWQRKKDSIHKQEKKQDIKQ